MGFWWGNLTERDYLEDPGTDGILKKQDWKAWTGLIWAVVNIAKASGSITCGEFLD